MKKRFVITTLVILAGTLIITSRDKSSYLAYNPEQCVAEIDCTWFAFKNMVFGNERIQKNDQKYLMTQKLNKWMRDLYVKIEGKNTEQYFPDIKKHMEFVSSNTPYNSFVFTNDRKPINTFVIITDDMGNNVRERYVKRFFDFIDGNNFLAENINLLNTPDVECFGITYTDKKNFEIFFSIIFLPDGELFQSCLNEELTQMMGLSYDIKGAKFTKFNDSNSFQQLTQLDKLLLRILYDPRIKTGMSIKETKKIFAEVYYNLRDNS